MSDMFGIVANVVSDRQLRTGAKVWVLYCNGDASKPKVNGLTKFGQRITKYTHYKRLENFRAAWVPEHMRDEVSWKWADKAIAVQYATVLGEMWKGVRYFSRDGKELKRDGISENAAFDRAAGSHQAKWLGP